MNEEPISPWTDHAERVSPDGRFVAVFLDGCEVGMGAPTVGKLRLRTPAGAEHLIADDAAASFVWSDDGRFLAYSKWRRNRNQALCVLRVADMKTDESPDDFRVLELRAFVKGKIEGVDSPVYMPRTLSITYSEANQVPEDTARKLADPQH